MKIHSSFPSNSVAPAASAEATRPTGRTERVGATGTSVTLSEDAKWIAALREEARAEGVREDLVQETQRALADGTYESTVDLDGVVDRLLADL